jgi:tRNA-Thr(GGU) m(6)t(6)A37 methyltransferase TsaA
MWRRLTFLGIMLLIGWGIVVVSPGSAAEINPPTTRKDQQVPENQPICLKPVGVVKQQGQRTLLEIQPEFAPALKGLEDFSHLWVFYWFHENDRPEGRATLQVHPRRDPANPLTGVFACRSPERPNLIGLTACRLVKVSGHVVEVADLDARDGSPILDLKPYIPEGDAIPGAVTPAWLKRSKPPAD